MALISCPECNKQISNKADVFVGCGVPLFPVASFPTIFIGNLEILQNDFPEKMTWANATKTCENLGKGWRLPTKDELNLLCKNKDKIGGFASNFYWSLPEYDSSNEWRQYTSNGKQGNYYKFATYYLRSVRAF